MVYQCSAWNHGCLQAKQWSTGKYQEQGFLPYTQRLQHKYGTADSSESQTKQASKEEMRQIRHNIINKFVTLIVCLRNRHRRNPQSHDFFSCYGKVFYVKCQLAFYHKVLWKTELKQMEKKNWGAHANHPLFYMPNIH